MVNITTAKKQVGHYAITPSLVFVMYERPNWFHRSMTRLLLGWKWADIKDV